MRAGYVITLVVLASALTAFVVSCESICKDAPNIAIHAGCAR